MDLFDAIKGRRSVRTYADRPVSDSVVEELIDLARHAPSSLNGQPWHFIIVRSQRAKDTLASIKNAYCPPEKQAYPADFIQTAPVVIVVCIESARSFGRDVENSVLAAVQIMLGAQSEGLGCVYMSAYMTSAPGQAADIGHELGLPAGIVPVSIIPLGYPSGAPGPRTLRPLHEIMHAERY